MKFLKFFKKYFIKIILGLVIFQFFYLFILANCAAWLFNKAMEEQEMLIGKVTVEKLYASISGKVDFEGLRWTNNNGITILYVPEGTIGVRPFDIVRGKFETSSLYRIRLKGAKIVLGVDNHMNPDFLPDKSEKKEPKFNMSKYILEGATEEERLRRSAAMQKEMEEQIRLNIKNFNTKNRKFDIEFILEECPIEIYQKGKHYYINRVDLNSTIKSGDSVKYRLTTGQFSGSMTGGSISLYGDIDLTSEEPIVDASAIFQKINPEALGLVTNFDSFIDLQIYFTGPLINPMGKGKISMANLTLPNLPFEDVKGEFTFYNNVFKFSSVTAKIWDGQLNLTGDYNLDTRYYHINGVAKNLSAKLALPKDNLITTLDANLHLVANENSRNMAIWGDFTTAPGTYKGIPFDSVSASFTNAYHDLRFYNAKIDIGYYQLSSDFIGVKDGKLKLDPVLLTNMNTGKLRATYVHPSGR